MDILDEYDYSGSFDDTEQTTDQERVFSLFEERVDNELENHAGMEALLSNVNFQSNNAILSVFENLNQDTVIDQKWANTLRRYVYSFITRRAGLVDYGEFFGSPYLGLQKIVFTSADRNQWFSEIIDVDEEELKENLHECKAIEKEWNVVGDAFNMTIPYLLHIVNKSSLDRKTKHQAMIDLVCMYHYKCLTSIINNDYPFNARKEVVLETYNRLSLKYDIKSYGSWRALIEARAEFIINPNTGIHYQAFNTMKDDKKIVYMVGDIQNRLRRVVNDINKVFHDVKNKTNIIKLDGAKVNLGDELTLKTVSKEINQYANYLERILSDESSFYKDELATYASEVLESNFKDKLVFVLQQFPALYNNPKKPKYKQFADAVLSHLFEYLHANKLNKTDVYTVLIKMRGAYGAPKTNNETVKIIRDVGDSIVKELTGIRTPQTVQTIRTALGLYFVLRIISMNHFQ